METKISQRVEAVIFFAVAIYLLKNFPQLSNEKRLLLAVPAALLVVGAIGIWRLRPWGAALVAVTMLLVAAYYGVLWFRSSLTHREFTVAVGAVVCAIYNFRVSLVRGATATNGADGDPAAGPRLPPNV